MILNASIVIIGDTPILAITEHHKSKNIGNLRFCPQYGKNKSVIQK
jgi:hypothetical protein